MTDRRSDRSRSGTHAASAIAPFLVHLFTALGAGLALLAILAAARMDWTLMFVWLGAALLVDGVDGSLARRFEGAERLPRWSGDALDLVVDFTSYVFVPAFALALSGILPGPFAVPLCIAIVVSSAIYFADRNMKTPDNFFRGFPALWNIAVFYLFILKPPGAVAALAVAGLVALTFAPIKVLHPIRVTSLRGLNLALLLLWCLGGLYALHTNLDPGLWVGLGLTGIALYFLLMGVVAARIDRQRN